jgi:hypothetical protein
VSWLRIKLDGARTSFHPGEVLAGTADWQLDGPARPGDVVALRLVWFTEGRGTPDVGLIDTVNFRKPGEEDHRAFRFQLPQGPYSFEGKLITLTWALEAAIAGKSLGRLEITVSPSGEPVRLVP